MVKIPLPKLKLKLPSTKAVRKNVDSFGRDLNKRVLKPSATSTKAFLPGKLGDAARREVKSTTSRAPKPLRIISDLVGPPTSRGGAGLAVGLAAIPGGKALGVGIKTVGKGFARGAGGLKSLAAKVGKGAARVAPKKGPIGKALRSVTKTPRRRLAVAATGGAVVGIAVGKRSKFKSQKQDAGENSSGNEFGDPPSAGGYDGGSEGGGEFGGFDPSLPPVTDNPVIPNFIERPAYEVGETASQVGRVLLWMGGLFGATIGTIAVVRRLKRNG